MVGDPLNEFWRTRSGRVVRLLIRAKSRLRVRSAKDLDPYSRFSVVATRVRFFDFVKAQVGKWQQEIDRPKSSIWVVAAAGSDVFARFSANLSFLA